MDKGRRACLGKGCLSPRRHNLLHSWALTPCKELLNNGAVPRYEFLLGTGQAPGTPCVQLEGSYNTMAANTQFIACKMVASCSIVTSQVEAALAGTSSTTLLDAWGSQDHARWDDSLSWCRKADAWLQQTAPLLQAMYDFERQQ